MTRVRRSLLSFYGDIYIKWVTGVKINFAIDECSIRAHIFFINVLESRRISQVRAEVIFRHEK